jgi:hypothetical protein
MAKKPKLKFKLISFQNASLCGRGKAIGSRSKIRSANMAPNIFDAA